jgi:hypothetical protein
MKNLEVVVFGEAMAMFFADETDDQWRRVYQLAQQFVSVLKQGQAEALDTWLQQAGQASCLSSRDLYKDCAAILQRSELLAPCLGALGRWRGRLPV